MRIILLIFMVAAAHAATIQLKLDAFSLAPAGTKFAIQIKMMGKDGVVSPKSVKITNIKTTNLNFGNSTSDKIHGDSDEGFTLLGDGSNFLFTSDLLTLIMGGSGFPPLLTFDLEYEENGQMITADQFGIFLYEQQPSASLFAAESNGGFFGPTQTVLDPPGGPGPLLDPPPTTSGSSGVSGSSGASGTSGSSGSSTPTSTTNASEVPEPSTFGLLLLPLAAMILRRR